MRLYTGVPKASVFKALFEELPHGDMETSNRYKLRAINEFFMTLMRLKLGLVIKDLAFRFALPRPT